MRRRVGVIAAVVATVVPALGLGAQAAPADRWYYRDPSGLHVTGRMSDRLLAEASGAVRSVANPEVTWTIGDSGNPPELLEIGRAHV